MIDVTLLGTSALMPLPDRAPASAALSCSGRPTLLDCGEGTQTAARKAGVNLMKTDLIALTHYHGDHIFGLPGLLQTLNCLGRTEPLFITGPRGIREILSPILSLAGPLPFPVRTVAIPKPGLPLDSLAPGWPSGSLLQAFPTRHRVPSQGYRFSLARAGKFRPDRAKELGVPVSSWKDLQRGLEVTVNGTVFRPEDVLGAPRRGLSVFFSGDTSVCPGLLEGAKDSDLFICDATYGEDEQTQLAKEHGHMTFSQAGEAAAAAGASRLWLIHYSQMITFPEEYLPNALSRFPGSVCGSDGMSLTLRFSD